MDEEDLAYLTKQALKIMFNEIRMNQDNFNVNTRDDRRALIVNLKKLDKEIGELEI